MCSDDYNVWGPIAWYKFHEKAIKYPNNPCECDANKILCFYHKKFLQFIGCKTCENDYEKIIQIYPVKYGSRIEVFNWTVDVHNIINQKLGKTQIGYAEAYILWNGVIPFACDKSGCFQPQSIVDYCYDRVNSEISNIINECNTISPQNNCCINSYCHD